jgi:hypothetical protein
MIVKVGQVRVKGKVPGIPPPRRSLGTGPDIMIGLMPKRFSLPTASRRQVSTAMIILVLVLAVVYLTEFRINAPAGDTDAVQAFRNTCMKAARHANGGGDLVMDDATEAKIGAYCSCMVDAVQSNVPPEEIAKIARGRTSEKTLALLDRIVDGCKAQME